MTEAMAPSLRDDLVAAATHIAQDLRIEGAESERDRTLSARAVELLRDAGLWRVQTPLTRGGREAGIRAQVETSFVVANADSAAGWVNMVSNAHAWMIGSFPAECQEEVFAEGPDARVPGTLASQGRATRVDGGWRLSGRWQFASGVDHGGWVLIGAVADEVPESPSRALHVVVPKRDLLVDDTWFTLGLRGTGSKDIVADDVFVPAHRSIPTRLLFDGMSPHGEEQASHIYRLAVLVGLSVQLAATVVGIADGAVELHVERTSGRREAYTGASKAENAGIQMRVAESATEVQMAKTLSRAAADRCDQVAATGERLTIDERAELKWHAAYAVELSRRATERIFASAGAHGAYDESLLQARYRDVNTACHHAMVDFDQNAQIYGRTRLGLDPGSPLV